MIIKHSNGLSEHNYTITVVAYNSQDADDIEEHINNLLEKLIEEGAIETGFIEKQDMSLGLLDSLIQSEYN